MKYFFILFLIFTTISLQAQNLRSDKISPRLHNEISDRSNENLDVFIVLEDQINLDALLDSIENHQLSVKERAILINKKLRAIAAKSQPEVFGDLEKIGIHEYEPFWIVNSIYFTASKDQLYSLSLNDRIKYLDLNSELVIDEAVEVKIDGDRNVGSREIGLEVIKAPEMWAKGYTGYGTKAFVMDTGVDINHPALSRNYAGNVVPDDQAWFGFRDGNNRPYDCQNHGSHVTGTILGVDRKNQDTIGVAYNAMWMGAPILLVCGGNTAIRMAGFQWALDPDDNPDTTDDMPDVINNSWTDTNVDLCYEVYTQLFTVLEAAGIAVVFAAGNDGPGIGTISAPKNINVSLVNTFSVGAVNANNLDIANFSSRGPSACGGEGSLLIKPEVSAPGVGVRSSIPGDQYAEFNGTSMAAPHAAGAILLLKEAFPQLSGVEIKLALYFSAIDLGEPGEDNVYGMGLIDVDAAYDYLVNEGFEPSNPIKKYDLALTNFDYSVDYCEGIFDFTIELKNQGEENIDTILVEFFADETSIEPFHSVELVHNLLPGGDLSVNVDLTAEEDGIYQWMIKTSIQDKADERPLNNSVKMFVDFNRIQDWDLKINEEDIYSELCGGTNVIISNLDEESTLVWYDDSSSEDPIFVGNSYLKSLPTIDSLLILYAGIRTSKEIFSNDSGVDQQNFIPMSRSGVVIKILQEVNLNSFEFEVNERGLYSVGVVNDANVMIWVSNRFYDVGTNVLTPNISLSKDQTYTIFISGNRPVKINRYGFSNDEAISGYLNSLGVLLNNEFSDTLFSPISNLNFSFEVPCSRKPVFLNIKAVESAPKANFSIEGELDLLEGKNVNFLNETVGANLYEWNFGDGNFSNEFSPIHVYEAPGSYTVILKATDVEGCSDYFQTTITILEDMEVSTNPVVESYSIHVFPNPTHREINIHWEGNSIINAIGLYSISGIKIYEKNSSLTGEIYNIDLTNSAVTAGIYVLRILLNDGTLIHRRVVII